MLSMTYDLKLSSVNRNMPNLVFSSETEGQFIFAGKPKSNHLYLPGSTIGSIIGSSKYSPLYFAKAQPTILLALISP